jgi:flagellar basal-body rod protein FlgB
MQLLFDRLNQTIERHLDFRLERGNMIAANVANVDTPDYTPVDLKFDQQLVDVLKGHDPQAVRKTHASHRGPDELRPRGDVEFDYHSLPDANGNSVDIDHEMSKLAENQLMYTTVVKALNKRMALMKYAIAEGQG